MTNENNKIVNEAETANNDCQEKIEKLNTKLQATANELEEISSLYAKSVKDGLDKAKKIKELEDKIAELEKQLKECQEKGKKAEELEKQLKECQKEREELQKQLKECQEKGKKAEELEKQLKECQEKNKKLEKELEDSKNRSGNNKTISISRTRKDEWKITGEVWSLATDKKGNLYVGVKSSQWHGKVFKLSSEEDSNFEEMYGLDGEVWSLAADKDDNIYAAIRTETHFGGIYKCLADKEVFKKIKGIDKSVTSITFDKEGNIFAIGWTGHYFKDSSDKTNYKCLKGENVFKPVK